MYSRLVFFFFLSFYSDFHKLQSQLSPSQNQPPPPHRESCAETRHMLYGVVED